MMYNHQSVLRKSSVFLRAFWNFWTSQTGAFLLAISGIAVGYYIFYVSRPILKYDTERVTFVSSQNDNDYKVNVHGKEYTDLYLTRVYLYNRGDLALSGTDVSKRGHDPIRIVIPQEAKVVHFTLDNTATTKAITAKLSPYNNDLVIDFDYLNPDYQIAASILHEDPNAEFKISGSALNVNHIERDWNSRVLKYWGFWVLGILYLILVLLYLYHHWYERRRRRRRFF